MSVRFSWEILKGTITEFLEDAATRLAAALAFYAVFSIGPLLVIVMGVAGLIFERESINREVILQLQSFVGAEGAQTVQTMLTTQKQAGSIVATVLGTAALLIGATGVFGQLQDSLNTIWEVKPKPGQGIWVFVRTRFLSFAMVLGIAFLLLVSMVISTLLQALTGMMDQYLSVPGVVVQFLHVGISLLVVILLFAMIFKVLPDAKVQWRDVWVGATGTGLLFTAGKFLIGIYLGREGVTSAYGAAGSVVVILLWVYYSSLILLFGAEFTQVYARMTGSRIAPSANAVPVTEAARAQEGIPHTATPLPLNAGSPSPISAESRSQYRPHLPASQARPPAPPISLAAALGAAFVGGWCAHKHLGPRQYPGKT